MTKTYNLFGIDPNFLNYELRKYINDNANGKDLLKIELLVNLIQDTNLKLVPQKTFFDVFTFMKLSLGLDIRIEETERNFLSFIDAKFSDAIKEHISSYKKHILNKNQAALNAMNVAEAEAQNTKDLYNEVEFYQSQLRYLHELNKGLTNRISDLQKTQDGLNSQLEILTNNLEVEQSAFDELFSNSTIKGKDSPNLLASIANFAINAIFGRSKEKFISPEALQKQKQITDTIQKEITDLQTAIELNTKDIARLEADKAQAETDKANLQLEFDAYKRQAETDLKLAKDKLVKCEENSGMTDETARKFQEFLMLEREKEMAQNIEESRRLEIEKDVERTMQEFHDLSSYGVELMQSLKRSLHDMLNEYQIGMKIKGQQLSSFQDDTKKYTAKIKARYSYSDDLIKPVQRDIDKKFKVCHSYDKDLRYLCFSSGELAMNIIHREIEEYKIKYESVINAINSTCGIYLSDESDVCALTYTELKSALALDFKIY